MSLGALNSTFAVLSLAFAGLTAVRLFRNGLYRRYRVLFAYLVFLVPFTAYPVLLNTRSATYFWAWVITEPVNLTFEVLVVAELCRLVLERYRGLSTIGRWGIYGGMAISIAISLTSLAPRIATSMSRRSTILLYLIGCSRGINLGLTVFLLLMMVLVSRYPVRLSRNVVLNAVVFAILFFCNTLTLLLRTIFDLRLSPAVETVMAGIGVLSFVLWFFLLTPAGELVHLDPLLLGPQDERRALDRLHSLNEFVLGLAGRL
jgi:hypothetical protein